VSGRLDAIQARLDAQGPAFKQHLWEDFRYLLAIARAAEELKERVENRGGYGGAQTRLFALLAADVEDAVTKPRAGGST
jgi:hypothetical protein